MDTLKKRSEFLAVAKGGRLGRRAFVVQGLQRDTEDAARVGYTVTKKTGNSVMLERTGVRAGDTVFVTGASGGVGSAAIQLAKARGATVIAVTSPAKSGALLELGADRTLNRDADYASVLGANSVDVVIDLVAGEKWPLLLEILKPKGRYAASGAIGGPMVTLDVRTLYLKDLSFFGCTVLEPQVFGNLVARIERKEVQPLVAETYPLKEISAAQEAFGQKGHIGKIVLEVA